MDCNGICISLYRIPIYNHFTVWPYYYCYMRMWKYLCQSLTLCRSHGECMSPCMFVAPPWKMIEVSNAKASSSTMLGSNVVAIIQNVPYRQNDCSLPCFWWGWPCIVRWLPADITWMEDWVFTQFFLFILRKTEF